MFDVRFQRVRGSSSHLARAFGVIAWLSLVACGQDRAGSAPPRLVGAESSSVSVTIAPIEGATDDEWLPPPEGGTEAPAPDKDAGGPADPGDDGDPETPVPDTTEPDASEPPPACSSDAECDDGEPCNGNERCDSFAGCMPGYPLECDDGLPCNGREICMWGQGCVSNDAPQCDDGDACDCREMCSPGSGCLAGEPVDCDDDLTCTADRCDSATGECVHDDHVEQCECKGTPTSVSYQKSFELEKATIACPIALDVLCSDRLGWRSGRCDMRFRTLRPRRRPWQGTSMWGGAWTGSVGASVVAGARAVEVDARTSGI